MYRKRLRTRSCKCDSSSSNIFPCNISWIQLLISLKKKWIFFNISTDDCKSCINAGNKRLLSNAYDSINSCNKLFAQKLLFYRGKMQYGTKKRNFERKQQYLWNFGEQWHKMMHCFLSLIYIGLIKPKIYSTFLNNIEPFLYNDNFEITSWFSIGSGFKVTNY